VEIAKDLPAGVDVTSHVLMDAITSASAASGPSGDNIFTEYRNEASLAVGKRWSRTALRAGYRYSAESDYWSHAWMAAASWRLWGDTATLAVTGGLGLDQVGRRVQGGAPTPPATPGAPCTPTGIRTCPLNSWFGGVGYSQVLSPTILLQGGYEFILMDGFLASPYRQVMGMPERVPERRWRNAFWARAAFYLPRTKTGLQALGRLYWDFEDTTKPFAADDPWHVVSATAEVRAYQELGRDVEIRLTARGYLQGPANFYCDVGARPNCYVGKDLFTSDPKLGNVDSLYLEGKLYWEAVALREVPFFGWFSEGTFELSYGLFLQTTTFGTAHVLQTGYSLPF
ncbi:MAG: DUF3570 domain-containing protein, partial [Verrucomicrobiota bacterium]